MRRPLLLLSLAACTAELAAPTDGAIGEPVRAHFAFDGQTVTVTATRVAPDTSWLRMYAEAAACAGYASHPEGLAWFKLPGPIVFPDGTNWYGAYDAIGRSIFTVAGDTLSIRHEALHDLLWLDHGERGHPVPPFGACD